MKGVKVKGTRELTVCACEEGLGVFDLGGLEDACEFHKVLRQGTCCLCGVTGIETELVPGVEASGV